MSWQNNTDVGRFLRLTLPNRAVHLLDHDLINAVTETAGGVSVTKSHGQWIDGDGNLHEDNNDVFQWNHENKAGPYVGAAVSLLIRHVFDVTDEKSVLLERNLPLSGYSAAIINRPENI